MFNQVITIGYLRDFVNGILTVNTSKDNSYCPTYQELTNGSMVTYYQYKDNPKDTINGIRINGCSVGDGTYESNQLVVRQDLELLYMVLDDISISANRTSIAACGGSENVCAVGTFHVNTKKEGNIITNGESLSDNSIKVTWSNADSNQELNCNTVSFSENKIGGNDNITTNPQTAPSRTKTVNASYTYSGTTKNASLTFTQGANNVGDWYRYSTNDYADSLVISCPSTDISVNGGSKEVTSTLYYYYCQRADDSCGHVVGQKYTLTSKTGPSKTVSFGAQSCESPRRSEKVTLTSTMGGVTVSASCTVYQEANTELCDVTGYTYQISASQSDVGDCATEVSPVVKGRVGITHTNGEATEWGDWSTLTEGTDYSLSSKVIPKNPTNSRRELSFTVYGKGSYADAENVIVKFYQNAGPCQDTCMTIHYTVYNLTSPCDVYFKMNNGTQHSESHNVGSNVSKQLCYAAEGTEFTVSCSCGDVTVGGDTTFTYYSGTTAYITLTGPSQAGTTCGNPYGHEYELYLTSSNDYVGCTNGTASLIAYFKTTYYQDCVEKDFYGTVVSSWTNTESDTINVTTSATWSTERGTISNGQLTLPNYTSNDILNTLVSATYSGISANYTVYQEGCYQIIDNCYSLDINGRDWELTLTYPATSDVTYTFNALNGHNNNGVTSPDWTQTITVKNGGDVATVRSSQFQHASGYTLTSVSPESDTNYNYKCGINNSGPIVINYEFYFTENPYETTWDRYDSLPSSGVSGTDPYNIVSTINGEDCSFSVSSNQSWLTYDSTSWYVIPIVSKNTSSSSRSGTLTLTQYGSNKKLYIVITQEGYAPSYTHSIIHSGEEICSCETEYYDAVTIWEYENGTTYVRTIVPDEIVYINGWSDYQGGNLYVDESDSSSGHLPVTWEGSENNTSSNRVINYAVKSNELNETFKLTLTQLCKSNNTATTRCNSMCTASTENTCVIGSSLTSTGGTASKITVQQGGSSTITIYTKEDRLFSMVSVDPNSYDSSLVSIQNTTSSQTGFHTTWVLTGSNSKTGSTNITFSNGCGSYVVPFEVTAQTCVTSDSWSSIEATVSASACDTKPSVTVKAKGTHTNSNCSTTPTSKTISDYTIKYGKSSTNCNLSSIEQNSGKTETTWYYKVTASSAYGSKTTTGSFVQPSGCVVFLSSRTEYDIQVLDTSIEACATSASPTVQGRSRSVSVYSDGSTKNGDWGSWSNITSTYYTLSYSPSIDKNETSSSKTYTVTATGKSTYSGCSDTATITQAAGPCTQTKTEITITFNGTIDAIENVPQEDYRDGYGCQSGQYLPEVIVIDYNISYSIEGVSSVPSELKIDIVAYKYHLGKQHTGEHSYTPSSLSGSISLPSCNVLERNDVCKQVEQTESPLLWGASLTDDSKYRLNVVNNVEYNYY